MSGKYASKEGLVQKSIAVKRDGKWHTRQQWVKPSPVSHVTRKTLMPAKDGVIELDSCMNQAETNAHEIGQDLIDLGCVGVTVESTGEFKDGRWIHKVTCDGLEYDLGIPGTTREDIEASKLKLSVNGSIGSWNEVYDYFVDTI